MLKEKRCGGDKGTTTLWRLFHFVGEAGNRTMISDAPSFVSRTSRSTFPPGIWITSRYLPRKPQQECQPAVSVVPDTDVFHSS